MLLRAFFHPSVNVFVTSACTLGVFTRQSPPPSTITGHVFKLLTSATEDNEMCEI